MPKSVEQKAEPCVRYDEATLKIIERGDGFLRAEVVMAEAGVYPYLDASGRIIMEAKLPEEIFAPEAMATAEGLIVTDQHPPKDENKGLVTSETYKKYLRGTISSPTKNGVRLCGTEIVFDKTLIGSLKAGDLVQVSLGQQTIVDATPGVYNGIRYDQAQRRIRYNHMAHVDRGRLGDKAKIQLDSSDLPEGAAVRVDNADAIAEATENAKIKSEPENKENQMPKSENGDIVIKRDSKEHGIFKSFFESLFRSDAADPEPDPKKTEPAKSTSNEKALQARVDQLEATVDTMTDLNGALKKELEKFKTDAADVKGRDAIVDTAKGIIKDFKTDGLSNREIMLKVIEGKLPYKPEVKQDKLSDDLISSRFDAACEIARFQAAENPDKEKGTQQTKTTQDAEEVIRERRAERLGLGKQAGK